MQDWSSIKRKEAGTAIAENQNHATIDEGIQKYIIEQQNKRTGVQTGYIVNNGKSHGSMQDKREIFSEEDFCNPDYYKFTLPEFSKQHHESLHETHSRKLEQ